jgi:hypothetical protein
MWQPKLFKEKHITCERAQELVGGGAQGTQLGVSEKKMIMKITTDFQSSLLFFKGLSQYSSQ